MNRSVNIDLEELEAGTYSVLMKISAKRWPSKPTPDQVIRENCRDRPNKLIQVGLSYDLAQVKGQIRETEAEKQRREAIEEKKKAIEKKKRRAEFREQKFKAWQLNVKQRARDKRHAKASEERRRKRAEIAAANAAGASAADDDAAPTDAEQVAAGADEEEPTPASETEEAPLSESTKLEQDAATLPSPEADPEPESTEPAEPDASDNAVADEVPGPDPDQTNESAPQDDLPSSSCVLVNGDFAEPDPATALAPSSIIADGAGPLDDSEYDSDASFDSSIDSDLDFPEPVITTTTAAPNDPAAVVLVEDADADDENVEFENDPWNAVCVVGLRVYSKDPGTGVEVVRPRDEDDDALLDVDDVSKGASGELVVAEEKVEEMKREK